MRIRPGVPFRGSAAVASGALTRAVLFGPRFQRLLPDVHVSADTDVDLEVLSMAAAVLVGHRGVLSGYSAAEILGASCARLGAPAEVTLLGGYLRRPGPGLIVHRDRLRPDEMTRLRGLPITTAARTARDLARRAPDLTEAVVAVDALCHQWELDPGAVLVPVPGARGVARFPEILRLADAGAGSPMETRIRLIVVGAGLPRPVAQHRVAVGGHVYDLDLAYPDLKLAIEHNGPDHLTPARARRDLVREQLLVAAGWRIVRFDAATVLYRPHEVAARVAAELRARQAA